ncbi:hypothetical protein FQR62_02215 [Campylobacter coli]|nr:hypothetical protein [Campylobacter coli]ECK0301533.1 hypothetical protein [Campylobacter coli]EFP6199973.1 hypothetical protein [Campylobacter coli]EHF1083265.1 hypothetical protein [Campylobacter coli]
MFDFFINYMIFCAKDPSKLFLGTLALFLFVFFGIMFFICEGVFLYVLLFCEIILFLYMLLGIFYIRNQKLFYKIFDYFIALQKLFKRKI